MNTETKSLADKEAWKTLQEGCEVLERLGIKYWIAAGTLLGAYRENGFIPWDTDLDVEIYTDYKIDEIIKNIGWPVLQKQKNMYGKKHYSQVAFLAPGGIIFDIYPFYKNGDELENISASGKLWYPKSKFSELTEIEFYGRKYPCPEPAWYVEFRYGPQWNIPNYGKWNWEKDAYNLIINQNNSLEYFENLPKLGKDHPLGPEIRFRSLELGLLNVTIDGIYAEFGVATGFTANYLLENIPEGKKLYLFDSFDGLPQDWYEKYKIGYFKQDYLPEMVNENGIFEIGMFETILPKFLEEIQDVFAFIHIDCDLYCSTKTILDNCNDRIVPGTIICFDEYYNFPVWQEHEHKAFMEWLQKYRRDFEYLGRTIHQQAVVRIMR